MRERQSFSLPLDTKDALGYLGEKLQEAITNLTELMSALYDEQTVAPSKPREGMIRFADGTSWNPGSGRGLYQYVSGAWVKL